MFKIVNSKSFKYCLSTNLFNIATFSKNLIKISNLKFNTFDNIKIVNNNNVFQPITLVNLKSNPGSRIVKTRVGRGPGSGKAKTSGRGHKGYKAHVGNVRRHYEGGQTPITRRLPKHGFRRNQRIKELYNYINLEKIIYLVLKGRIDPSKVITIRDLYWSGGISKLKKGLKLLSRGSEKLSEVPPLNIEVSSASQKAIDEIKKHGGSISSVYRTELTLRYHVKPWKFMRAPMDPVPPFKKTIRLMNLQDKGVE